MAVKDTTRSAAHAAVAKVSLIGTWPMSQPVPHGGKSNAFGNRLNHATRTTFTDLKIQ